MSGYVGGWITEHIPPSHAGNLRADEAAPGQDLVPEVRFPTNVTLTLSLGLEDDRVTPLTPGPPEWSAWLGCCPHLQLVERAFVEIFREKGDVM